MKLPILFAATGLMMTFGHTAMAQTGGAACDAPPEPVVSLNFGSRYTDESVSRSDIDKESNAAVNAALAPIEQFLRDLASAANKVTEEGAEQAATADCVIEQMQVWSEADAFSDLGTITANFAIGARLAAFAMVYRQVAPYSSDMAARASIEDWLGRRAEQQMAFWEEDATAGAKTGNLRAWATLAINLAGEIRDDPVALRWSAWSMTYLQCQALEDGSLPQEMRRGKYALHYQLHAIAPMVLTTRLLEDQGFSILGVCDNALDRIVAYAINDLEDGSASESYSGKKQSYFDGTEELRSFELAWIEAYLTLKPNADLDAFADDYRPLRHSKLGGDQALLWREGI